MNWLRKLGKLFTESMEAGARHKAAAMLISMGRPEDANKVLKGRISDD